ncbi:MAG: alpha/beta fold hydrolase, partial [Planctomycetota bacterium]
MSKRSMCAVGPLMVCASALSVGACQPVAEQAAAVLPSGRVASGDARLQYYRTGDVDRPHVVLCHGLTDSHKTWVRLVPALEERYHVVTYDHRGHGESTLPPGDVTYKELSHDLVSLIRTLELRRPVLIGHSMGASTVTYVAAHHPELVGGIIVVDPPWGKATFDGSPKKAGKRVT